MIEDTDRIEAAQFFASVHAELATWPNNKQLDLSRPEQAAALAAVSAIKVLLKLQSHVPDMDKEIQLATAIFEGLTKQMDDLAK
jgi:hypothetical protein